LVESLFVQLLSPLSFLCELLFVDGAVYLAAYGTLRPEVLLGLGSVGSVTLLLSLRSLLLFQGLLGRFRPIELLLKALSTIESDSSMVESRARGRLRPRNPEAAGLCEPAAVLQLFTSAILELQNLGVRQIGEFREGQKIVPAVA
jgi:hypothetical protein